MNIKKYITLGLTILLLSAFIFPTSGIKNIDNQLLDNTNTFKDRSYNITVEADSYYYTIAENAIFSVHLTYNGTGFDGFFFYNLYDPWGAIAFGGMAHANDLGWRNITYSFNQNAPHGIWRFEVWYREDPSIVDETEIFFIKELNVDISGPVSGLVDEPLQFIALIDYGLPPYNFAWDFGDGNISGVQDPIHAYSQPGVYHVTLTVNDSYGMISNASTNVTIVDFNDQIDQQQTLWDGAAIGVHNPALAAQSFKPSLNTITRIQIIAYKEDNPTGIVTGSIRSSLDGEDIASASIDAEDLEIEMWPIKTWVEFDFGEIPVTPEETYYFIWDNQASEENGVVILATYHIDAYDRGCSWMYDGSGTWYKEFYDIMDHCFITYGFHEERADLSCEGSLSWTDVQGGSTVEGSFTIENIGGSGTLLDWEIESYPEWGTWTFDPNGGTGLTPEDGAVTIDVEVVAPDDPNTDFTGEIKIGNSENPYDFCIIDVSLSTPVNQQHSHPFLQRFPVLYQIFLRI